MNFATLGFLIGHEITHGFDDTSRFVDGTGNRVDWWSPSSAEEFANRSNCFREQYSKYYLDGFKVNENATLTENIADNGGLNQAYKALRIHAARYDDTMQRLPGSAAKYSTKQLFYLSFAQVSDWVTKVIS